MNISHPDLAEKHQRSISKKLFWNSALFSLLCIFSMLAGCTNDPNDLGLNYINPNDTLGSKILESNSDTMLISERNVRVFSNSYAGSNFLVGSSQYGAGTYQAKSLLKFTGLPSDRAGENVISAFIRFKYDFYAFRDSTGTVSFNIYRVNRNLTFATVTVDSISPSDIGTTLIGSYTGNPSDVSDINVTIDPNAVKDWLSFAADTNSLGKNYGLYFVPNSSSTTIKGFYTSYAENVNFRPQLTAIVDSNGTHDTLNINTSDFVSLIDAPLSVIPSQRIFVQGGVSFLSLINFDLSKLPSRVIINEAYLELTIDPANSFITQGNDKRVNVDRVIDSVLIKANSDNFTTNVVAGDTTKYYVRFNQYMQGWSSGIYPQMGLLLSAVSSTNLNRIVFYDQTAADVNNRPKLRIRYTNKF